MPSTSRRSPSPAPTAMQASSCITCSAARRICGRSPAASQAPSSPPAPSTGQVVQARAQQQAALYTYDQTIQAAFSDVENALSSHGYLIQEQEAQTRLVAAAGDYVRLSELQFKGGYAPYFVVIQAQEQYFPAQLSWVQTRSDLFISLVNIYQALGGGWVFTAEEMTDDECQ